MGLKELWDILRGNRWGMAGVIILVFFLLVALFAPWIAPYDPLEPHYNPDGTLKRMEPPSWAHPFGTDRQGRDLFSQVVLGTRAALLVGLTSGIIVAAIGTAIGIVSGFMGGRVDAFLMRLTDIVYAIPALPFTMIVVSLLGPSVWNIILAIVLVIWRGSARVIRSQVLSLRERAFVQAARVSGASDWLIMTRHILPNVLPVSLVYTALATGAAILDEAAVSFLGYGDPLLWSWGKVIFMAYVAQAMTEAWWWVVPPGVAIVLLVLATYLIGRTIEEYFNPRLRQL